MKPVTYDRWEHRITTMTPLRERRLLAAAWGRPSINHKAFYSQYLYLMGLGLIRWLMGTACLTEAGQERLRELIEEGV